MAPRNGDEVNPPAVADGQGPADWSDDDDDAELDTDDDSDDSDNSDDSEDSDENEEYNVILRRDLRRQRIRTEEIPEWIKVDYIEDFKRLCEIHCGNGDAEAAFLEMRELRRQQQQQNPENLEA